MTITRSKVSTASPLALHRGARHTNGWLLAVRLGKWRGRAYQRCGSNAYGTAKCGYLNALSLFTAFNWRHSLPRSPSIARLHRRQRLRERHQRLRPEVIYYRHRRRLVNRQPDGRAAGR